MIQAAPAAATTSAPRTGTPPEHIVAFVLVAAFFALAPLGIYPLFLMKVMCFALFVCAFNLLIGFGGLLSFGHAMFLGTAGYVAAHTAKKGLKLDGIRLFGTEVTPGLSLPAFDPALAILFAVAVTAALGWVVGKLAIRRQGIYFAMITLAISQMIYFFYLQAPFTGGEDGIQAVPRGRLAGLVDLADPIAMYATVWAIFLAGFLAIYRIVHSPFGQVLKAIRENEPRTVSLGYRVDQYKLLAFVLSATFAGLAGATKAIVFQSASLTDVHWTMSGEVVLMALVGGMGTMFGPVVGAFVLLLIEEVLAERAGAWIQVIQGGIFVACVLAFRRGIVGEIGRLLKKPL
jgi:branched-chain amino acid transport system permease protein